ncbi:uncharacterized protein N7473_000334 [Penicillium subrubescens]|uniref:uncharacterized protein n=1 Tax=Penicillium subrubescens TaxID=1316194 RepID=UPI0025454DF5|nr:uncharacterized protein N7473_000334 [Penicillium subrubescens]KAJ5911031.1 hypothetical protein N7473_000334 [Penicillium subrubescens]
MSDFFRRASDALQHRQRQGSTDSMDAPQSPDAAKYPEQDKINQKVEPSQSDSRPNEVVAGKAAGNEAHPKQHRYWVWGHHQGNKPLEKQQSNQDQKDDTDWVIGS